MYRFLSNRMPEPLAQIIMVVWYTVLLVLILVCGEIPELPFRYLGI